MARYLIAISSAGIRHWLDAWAPLASWLVAAGTIFLAIATFRLAGRAAEEAKAVRDDADRVVQQIEVANRQVEVSVAALRSSMRPWLSRAAAPNRPPTLETQQDGSIFASVQLRNVGNGLALLQSGRLRAHARGSTDLIDYPNRAFFRVPALPPGEETLVYFVVSPRSLGSAALTAEDVSGASVGIFGDFFVDVMYTDADGAQPTWANAHIAATSRAADWVVHRIEYYREGENDPFTAVEFR